MDLSYTAAHKLGILGNGSSEVEIESLAPDAGINTLIRADTVESKPLEKAEPAAGSAPATTDSNVYLQLGAFKSQEAAESFMAQMSARLGDAGKPLGVFLKDGLTRVHLGPYANQDEARSSADSLKGKLGFKPLVNLH